MRTTSGFTKVIFDMQKEEIKNAGFYFIDGFSMPGPIQDIIV